MPYDVSEYDVGEDGLYGGLPDTAVVPVDSSQGDQGGFPVVPVAPVSSTQNVQPASTDPLAHAYDNATYNIFNPAGWMPSASDLGTLAFDPAIFEGTLQMQGSTRGGGGLQGAQFAGGVDPKIATSAQSDPYYEIQKNLSDLLKSNQFDKAVSYAQENYVLDYLTTPSALKNLREPFTANEAASFLQSMSKVDPGADHKYNPETALSASMSQWDSSTGYPGYGGGVYRVNTTFDNIMNNLVSAALYSTAFAAAAPFGAAAGALGSAGGAGAAGGLSVIPSSVLNAAAKSAIGNAIIATAKGGNFGDILKAAASGAVTGGAGAAVASTFAPTLQEALSSAGASDAVARSAAEAAIAASQAAIRGQDPLQAAFVAGMGSYASLRGDDLIKQFANQSGISAELARQLIGPAGAAIASSIVGGDALRAAANQFVNQNYDEVLKYAKQQFREYFPEAAGNIQDFTDKFKEFLDKSGSIFNGLLPGKDQGSIPTGVGGPSGNNEDGIVISGSKDNSLSGRGLDLSGNGSTPPQPPPPQPPPPQPPPLEKEIVVSGKKDDNPPSGGNLDFGNTGSGQQPPKGDDGLEQLKVEGKKDDNPPSGGGLDLGDTGSGQLPTRGDDGLEQLTVTGTQPKDPPLGFNLNPFDPTFNPPDVDPNYPFDLDIKTGGKTGGLGTLASGAAPEQFPWLDTSDQFLKAKPTTAQGAKLAQLQQIFSQLDPNLRDVLADKGYTPAAMGGSIRSYAEGSSVTCCFKAVLKDLAPNFVPCTQEMLAPLASRRQRTDVLAKLNQIKPMIMGGAQGYAKGGLPSQYAEAAPEGHNPEFITGLTGYYAQGGGTGQSDDIPAMLHDGDYVMDADTVAAFGDGSSKAGAQVLDGLRKQVPYRNVKQGKAVPAKIADGEYVFPADFVTALGQGDNKRGAKMLDAMRERLRAHKRSAPTSKIPPKAKSPMDYMRGKG